MQESRENSYNYVMQDLSDVHSDSKDSQYSKGDEALEPIMLGNAIMSEQKIAEKFPGKSISSTHRKK